MTTLIGLLGGSFDPVHRGHLHIAHHLLETWPALELHFLPCYRPSHRPSLVATPEQRLTMLRLALHDVGEPRFSIDTQEMDREGTSYTIDTVEAIRANDTITPYALMMSSEAWSHFHTWRLWERILSHVHLIIVDRPGYTFPPLSAPPVLTNHLMRCQTEDPNDLYCQPFGCIFYHVIPSGVAISATAIRQALRASDGLNREALSFLTPSVADYIIKHTIYN